MLLPVVCLCGLRPRRQEIISKQYCTSLRTALVVFVKCRRSESKCCFRSYVFADCGHEDKRKCKSNIVCLCGLQWLCLLSVHMWWGLSMWVFLRDRRSIWWGWIVTPVASRTVNEVSYVMRTKYRRSESKCFFRSYVFADCGHEDKRKSKSNIVRLCGLQWLCLLSVGDLQVNVSSGRMSLRTAATKTRENRKAILYVFADCNGCVC